MLAAMSLPDLNLLIALDVLLTEGSVARAARRLRLSPSAMSRTLARLRAATGDPLLVRAGRGLVPSPRAIELRERVAPLVAEAVAALRPAESLDLTRLSRDFTIRAREGFVEAVGAALLARVAREAPGARLRFVAKTDRTGTALRDGSADLDTGVATGTAGPELRARALFRDRFVVVVRQGHPLLDGEMTADRYVVADHVQVSLGTRDRGPVDDVLATLGLERRIKAFVGGFSGAVAMARESDLVATLPDRDTLALRAGTVVFPLPFEMPEITISLMWHPRMEADPAHRWLRGIVREVCAERFR